MEHANVTLSTSQYVDEHIHLETILISVSQPVVHEELLNRCFRAK